jgi:hypothetical protein
MRRKYALSGPQSSGFPSRRFRAIIGQVLRIIHIPLSGGDRKAQAKGIRYAHGIHESYFRESVQIQSTRR